MVPCCVYLNYPSFKILPEFSNNIPFSSVVLSVSSYFRQDSIGVESSRSICKLQFSFSKTGLQIDDHISVSAANCFCVITIGSLLDIKICFDSCDLNWTLWPPRTRRCVNCTSRTPPEQETPVRGSWLSNIVWNTSSSGNSFVDRSRMERFIESFANAIESKYRRVHRIELFSPCGRRLLYTAGRWVQGLLLSRFSILVLLSDGSFKSVAL